MPGERDDGEVDERADGYREKDRAALDVEKLGRIADKKGTKCVARAAPDDRDAEDIGDRPAVVRDHPADRACRTVLPDWQSVGEGKSVSERWNLGGGGIIKKKN